MRKLDLVDRISKKTGVPKVDILLALESYFNEVKKSLVQGDNVYVRGFGSFVLKTRKARKARDIRKNTVVEIPEYIIPAFKPSKEFSAAVRDIKPGTGEQEKTDNASDD